MSKVSWIKTEKSLIVQFSGKRFEYSRKNEPDKFDEIIEFIKAGDFDGLVDYLTEDTIFVVDKISNGKFLVDKEGGRILDVETKTIVELFLGAKIMEWAQEGLPFDPLLKFHRKIIDNPNKESAADLYKFLDKNNIVITSEGNFLAYKKVKMLANGNLYDCHTGTIRNNPGDSPSMPREKVNSDRNITCSYGLHVCSFSYLKHFHGSHIILVEVDPRDVVSVPTDYDSSKMRCCKYKVIEVIGDKSSDATEKKNKLAVVKKTPIEQSPIKPDNQGSVVKDVDDSNITSMTAPAIKDYIQKNYGKIITTDNKNKKSIVKQAIKIMSENI